MVRYHQQQQRKKLQYNYPVSSNASSTNNGRHSSCFSPRSCGYFILLFFLGAILYNGIGNTFQYNSGTSNNESFSLLKVDETKTDNKDEIKVKYATMSLDTTKENKKQIPDNASNKKDEEETRNQDKTFESGDGTNYGEGLEEMEYKRDEQDADDYSLDAERSDTPPGNERHGVNDDEAYESGDNYKYNEIKEKTSDEENELDEETNNHHQQKMMDDDDVKINKVTEEVRSNIKNEYVTSDADEDNKKKSENITENKESLPNIGEKSEPLLLPVKKEEDDEQLNNTFIDKNDVVKDFNSPSSDLKEQKLKPVYNEVRIDSSHLNNLEKDTEDDDVDDDEVTGEIKIINADSEDAELLEDVDEDNDKTEKDKTNGLNAGESLNLNKVDVVDVVGSNAAMNQQEEDNNEEAGEINADTQDAELLHEEKNDEDDDEKEEDKTNGLDAGGSLNLNKVDMVDVVGSNPTMNQQEEEEDNNEETGEIGINADTQDAELLNEEKDDEDDDEKEEDKTKNVLSVDGSLYVDKVDLVDVSGGNAKVNKQEDAIEEKVLSNVVSEIKLNSISNETHYDGNSEEGEKDEQVREEDEEEKSEEIKEQTDKAIGEKEQKEHDDDNDDEPEDKEGIVEGKEEGGEEEELASKVKGKPEEIEEPTEEENGEKEERKEKDDHDEPEDKGKQGIGEKEEELASKDKGKAENGKEEEAELRKKNPDKSILSNIPDEHKMQNSTLGEPLPLELQEMDTLNVTDDKALPGRETINKTDDKDVGLISKVSNYSYLNDTLSLERLVENDLGQIESRDKTKESNMTQGSSPSTEERSTVTKGKKLRKPSKLASNLEDRVQKNAGDENCLFRNSPIYRKVFVYPTPGELNAWEGEILSEAGRSYLQDISNSSFQQWPWIELDRRARESSSGHYDLNETNAQYTTELLVRELMTHPKSCLRTYNPDDADLFYVPYLSSTEHHLGTNDLNKLDSSNSSYAQAILKILDENDYTEWENLFGLTSKFWKRRNGTDHILVFGEPLHGLFHPLNKRGNYHYVKTQKHLGTPIIISVEMSTTFVSMFPKCSLKNILVPYPNTVGSWYNGVEKRNAYSVILDSNLTASSSSAAIPAERYLYEQQQLNSTLQYNFSFMSLSNVPRPIGQYYKVGLHGGYDDMRKALNESYEMCSQSNKVLIANSINQHRDYAVGMRLSTFCPCPGGYSPSAKRMFDAVISGCIPVVLSHDFVWPFSTEFDTRTNNNSEYEAMLNPNDFSIRLNASDYKEQLLNVSTCTPLDINKPGLDGFLSTMPADEIVRLRKNLLHVAESYYSWYKPRADLPDNPLKDRTLPDGGISHMIVDSIAERARGRLYPACDDELQQMKQLFFDLKKYTLVTKRERDVMQSLSYFI